jgi:hypothetical protein
VKTFDLKTGAATVRFTSRTPTGPRSSCLPWGKTEAVQVAFLSDPNKLYVNTVTTNKLLRLDLTRDGTVAKITELKLSRASGTRRQASHHRGRHRSHRDRRTNGDNVDITTIKEGGMEGGTPGVTVTKGMAWAIEGKLRQREANNPEADKGPFRVFPVSLPK